MATEHEAHDGATPSGGGQPGFAEVLAAAERLQRLLPATVLVGGSAAAAHARHRVSFDDDHALADLRERFATILSALEEDGGWVTARIKPPVLILGSLDGIETGIRQLRRRRALEVEELDVGGHRLRVPTLPEMLRVKAWMALDRNATRDYLDVVALADRMGEEHAVDTLAVLDDYYADQRGETGARIVTQVAKQLAEPLPYDRDDIDLGHYRELAARWRRWDNVADACRRLAWRLLDRAATTGPAG
ncbi:MAG: hypothetical protein ACRDU8_05325 [Egibacteraceae bacterium]